jgi:hypothetical protein
MTGIRRLTVLSCSLDSGEQELVGAVDSTAQGLYQGGDATVQIVYVETPPSVNCLRQFREAHFGAKEQQRGRRNGAGFVPGRGRDRSDFGDYGFSQLLTTCA